MALRTVGVRLTAEISSYVSNMRRAAGTTKDFHQSLSEKAASGKLDAIADRAGVMGLALGAGFGMAVKSSMDFEKQMSAVKAATHASSGEVEKLRQAAMKAGADTQYSATEAARGIEELSKAGVSSADILGGGLSGALDLAAAGSLDVGEAAETAASAMTQFKLKGNQVPHVADLLAAAAGKAQGSVHDMGMALNQAGLVASQTGLSIEDTTGTLAAFASAGLTGSDAGTSFKQMLLMLQAPSDKTRDLMQKLGISAYDANGQFVGITNLAQQLKDKLGKLTPELRANALAQIFGADATRAASILYEQGAAGIQTWIDKTNDAGYASETAATKTDNLAGDLERLKGSLDTLMISSGSGATGGLRSLVQGLESLIDRFAMLPSSVTTTMTVLTGLGAAALLAGAGWIKLRRFVGEAGDELRKTGPSGAKAAVALDRTTKAAGRTAAAFAALQVAGMAANAAFGEELSPKIDALGTGLDRFVKSGDISGEAARLLGDDFGKLDTALKDIGDTGNWSDISRGIGGTVEGLTGLGEVFDDSLTKSRERLDALDQALQQMVSAGHGDMAAAVFQKVAERAKEQGVSVNELKKILPGYAAALESAGTGAKDVAAGADQAAGATGDLGNEMEDARKKAEDLQKAFDALFGRYMSADKAALQYQDALRATNKELKQGAKDLRGNTEEGGKNRRAVLDLIDSIKDQREANINNNMSVADADKKYRKQIDTLKATMRHLGFTKDDVNALINKYREVPNKIGTTITTPGLPNADQGIKNYDKKLDALARKVKTEVSVVGSEAAYDKLEKLLVAQQAAKKGISIGAAQSAFNKNRFAVGGWTGPGGMWDEAGVVHADEFVVRKASRRKIEKQSPGLLDHINEHGELPPTYATGGLVMPFPVNVRGTQIMSMSEALSKVTPAVPAGGRTSDWIVKVVRAAFPGMAVLSKDRPGAITLTGNRSYHSMGRAVDFPASKPLAEWINANYKARTRELITPWNSLNIHNGRRHTYTGAVYRQHNFSGGNAHDHWAMANGGLINEPIVGVGASGRTYSFGEYGPETVTPGRGTWQGQGGGSRDAVQNSFQIVVQVPATANQAEVGRAVVGAIQEYERRSGASWRR